jgi:hypothetical protein
MNADILERGQIPAAVAAVVAEQPLVDLHTHLYPPGFGTPVPSAAGRTDPAGLMLWGIDELVTYHYLIAEVYRVVPPSQLPYEQFWKMTRSQQADHVWKHLFVERSPLSEACRGILTTLHRLGLDPNVKDLASLRPFFLQQDPDRYIDRVMELAGIERITMTNAVFDDNERQRWLSGARVKDARFRAVLRIDPMLRDWPTAACRLNEWGFSVEPEITGRTVEEARRFLREWIDRIEAVYLAVSLPPEFRYPAAGGELPPSPLAGEGLGVRGELPPSPPGGEGLGVRGELPPSPLGGEGLGVRGETRDRLGQAVLEQVILPTCAERGLPFAMMIGSRLRVNPALRDAGDMVGQADVQAVVNLCRAFPDNRFLVTMLSRENQHELAVAARKFSNLLIFGCWWFLNNPSLIDEITRLRVELLGTSFVPQHSDARILDQLIYKWDHSRRLLARILSEKYVDLADTGWQVRREDIQRDVRRLLRDNFLEFSGQSR